MTDEQTFDITIRVRVPSVAAEGGWNPTPILEAAAHHLARDGARTVTTSFEELRIARVWPVTQPETEKP